MVDLRDRCPWDAEQTHRSLLNHLLEETAEVVDAVETGTDDDLREELGDLLLQVYFHARIAEQEGRFGLDDVARGISDKLIRRHPHVFADEDVPDDMWQSWEERKRAEKGRSSALDGIAESLNVLPRIQKVVSRARSHQVDLDLPDEPIDEATLGDELVALIARAQSGGIDADAAARAALRRLEATVRVVEGTDGHPAD
ncbi:nucleoside triphosphate pyrophosphohydrolase [Tessaracoccus aquimaris]|uniref:Nucleoside triphosphate pyrophosphohydrolase n=1 Tax=Tessaracoccus aquimaris TaxID=1332264 RepID=A0A1Q2CT83_9ACTN|nr:MazG family protein [Tessaracoccus aquimaris]AQP49342.1 nucleoside triphosphate pyrophosphohydrolase [Tessaracoccus aquimaris]